MALRWTTLLVFFWSLPAFAQLDTAHLLERVAEEAEVLQQNAVKILTQETLQQRAVLPPTRFQPRIGKAATVAPPLRLQIREIISEFSFGALRDSETHDLLEFRQVVTVDGKPVQTAESARRALTQGIQSVDDRVRKRMLETFATNGLVDIATDYSLILLLFTKRGQGDLQILQDGEAWVGADHATTFTWMQTSKAGGALEFHGAESQRIALQGTIWIRSSDGLPLRINAWIEHMDKAKHNIRDDATIEYAMSGHGFVTPASVVHHHVVDRRETAENRYLYEPFKQFSASTSINFTNLPSGTAPATPPVKKK